MKTIFKKNGGFTLVELIVVIAILAILAGIAIPAYSGYITKANDASAVTQLGAVSTAAMGAYAEIGEVTGVSVDASGNVTITPAAEGWEADFATFYGAAKVDMTKLAGSTYAGGATWTPADGWTPVGNAN